MFMPTKIAVLSNTITRPLNPYLRDFTLVHFPLDTMIASLYNDIESDGIFILLDSGFFFENDLYDKAIEQFEHLHHALIDFRKRHKTPIVINTVSHLFTHPHIPATAHAYTHLCTINNRISKLPETISECAVMDWFGTSLQEGLSTLINTKNRYLFQTPWTKYGLEKISELFRTSWDILVHPRFKAIAVDADNTLWGGIIGEDGVEEIKIDRNYPGIVYRHFQNELLKLKESGIILILLSKNDMDYLKPVFKERSMPLQFDDFTAAKIDWNSKADNLAEILQQINIGKESVVFLDDSSVEIEEMRSRLNVTSFKMNPENPYENIALLRTIHRLKTYTLTEEDRIKAKLYQEEFSRYKLSEALHSKADFIASLSIEISPSLNQREHLQRAVQLIHKTNQFNLTTKRYTSFEVEHFMEHNDVYTFEVSDRFGSMGMVAVAIIIDNEIDTFLISCRVLGREVEENILAFLCNRYAGLKAAYLSTSKNKIVEIFYESNGFERIDATEDCKRYRLINPPLQNSSIKVHPCPLKHS